jgi:hypothetical protein
MGYDIYISRADFWWQNAERQIDLDEWKNLVNADPELSFSVDDDVCEFARWSGVSEYPDPWIAWSSGNIYSKNPDPSLLAKMRQLAIILNAKLQGEEGELV